MISREELSRLDREFPLAPRYVKYDDKRMYDSKVSYLSRHKQKALWLLDNSELLLEVLQKYRRITEITFEGEKLSE